MRCLRSIATFILICLYGAASAQCNTPTLSLPFISPDSVFISWTTSGAVMNIEYAVLPASAPQPTTGTTSVGTNAGINGLSANTAYKAWIKANCSSTSSSVWGSISFSTPCGVPSTINVTNVRGDSADISWTSVSPGANYQYSVDTLSSAPASGTGVSTNSVRVKGLLPAKTYYVYVRTDCGGGSYSFWSSAASFFTQFPTNVNGEKLNKGNISIYPNPATNVITVSVQGNLSNAAITLYNMNGAALATQTINNNSVSIDISTYPTGLYILKYTDAVGSKVLKLTKQ
jgi:hypothetical protein